MKKILAIFMFGLSSALVAAEPDTTITAPAAVTENTTNIEAADTAAPDTATTPAAETTELAGEQAGFSRGSVVRSIFTTAVQDREPVDKLNEASSEQNRVFYFTELRDMSGQTAIHRWEKDGEVQAEVKFDVRGPRWRVWSSKNMMPTQAGEWKVSVLNGAGEIIAEETLSLSAIPADAPQADPASSSDADADSPIEEPAGSQFEAPVTDTLLQ